MKMTAPLAAIVLMIGSFGCAHKQPFPENFSALYGSAVQRTKEIEISKRKLDSILAQGGGLNEIRLVQVFRRADTGDTMIPEYRIFDVKKGGAYDLLGLENTDILLAANDRLIFDQRGFRIFVTQVLKTQNEATININREGVAMLMRYRLVE